VRGCGGDEVRGCGGAGVWECGGDGVMRCGGVGVRGCLVLVFEFRLRGQELFFFWNCRHTNLTKV